MKKVIMFFIIFLSIFSLVSCDVTTEESFRGESKKLDDNYKRVSETAPVPVVNESLERKNISRRIDIFNKSDKISYIYLISYGKIISFHTVKGKISNVSSYMTPQEKLVDWKGRNCEEWNSGSTCYTVEAPDVDGTFGTNGDAIFFFTTEGAYVEWKGEYMVSDFPLKITETPTLIREVK